MSKAEHGRRRPSRDQPTPPQIARRLISGRGSAHSGYDTPARAAAGACDHLYRELARWVGSDGCHELFTRALADARVQNAPLDWIQLRARSDPYIDGVAEAIMEHGDPATADSMEALIVRLVEILGSLIGDNMSAMLIERSLAELAPGNSATGDTREEA
ncbi:MAG TPA: hypothetical protein VKB91_09605 [Gemmatimonadaceae bacterium]|nr:hypothetical protein [Gemmatimonadaceae bacterium]